MSAETTKRPSIPFSYVLWICCCILPPCIAFSCYETPRLYWLDPATLFFAGAARACLVGLVVSYVCALPVTSLFWLLLRRHHIGLYLLPVVASAVAILPFISMGDLYFSALRGGICVVVAVLARLLWGLAARVRRG